MLKKFQDPLRVQLSRYLWHSACPLDEIFKLTMSIDVTKLMKIKITSFYNNFGFVDMEPIRKKLVEMCKCDPTFKDIDMKIYISAFCLNTSETVYFSKDTHPDMKVIDAVCV